MTTAITVEQLKEAGQDFEFYPTTAEMIGVVIQQIKQTEANKILDIGAGDGRVLEAIGKAFVYQTKEAATGIDLEENSKLTLYSIEKSAILRAKQDKAIITIGCDLHQQTLIDKKMDAIFCNPPYSEFVEWTCRIIREANCAHIYFVIPRRWQDNQMIKLAIASREAKAKILWSGNFLDGDRAARAIVDIVDVDLSMNSHYSCRKEVKTDPFDLWFTEFFPEFDKPVDIETAEEHTARMNEMVAGKSRIEHLVTCYRQDMDKLCTNYRAVGLLDAEILKELGTCKATLKASLKEKINGLKVLYWKELINRLDAITDRLTSKTRATLLEKINHNLTVDFTEDNAYAVVLWMIKNANSYMDKQLVETFRSLSNPESAIRYKSNDKVWAQDRWRFHEDKFSHYVLDYRIVSQQSNATKPSTEHFGDYKYPNGLSKYCHDFIGDIVTVGKNLGFNVSETSMSFQWVSGKKNEFYLPDGTLFMEVKAYQNGNLHFRFNQTFIKMLNIEASRLLGWIKTPADVAAETDIDFEFAAKCFGANFQLANNSVKLLCD